MKRTIKIGLLIVLWAVILGAAGLTLHSLQKARQLAQGPNPNVTVVTAPDQADFEIHPDWTVPETVPIDYGENLALGKKVKQNGQTDVYNCRNVNDGDRMTYWEGSSTEYPNTLTFDMEAPATVGSFRILLNPFQIWSARTQEVELLISEDGENFTTALAKKAYDFDPMEDNSVYVVLEAPVTARYIRFAFYSNTGAKGGQAAEIELYEKSGV